MEIAATISAAIFPMKEAAVNAHKYILCKEELWRGHVHWKHGTGERCKPAVLHHCPDLDWGLLKMLLKMF